MTARERALKEFRKRWKKDAESDGEELPISQQLENAWKLGWEALAKELKEWVAAEIQEWLKDGNSKKYAAVNAEAIIEKLDCLNKNAV